MKCFLRLLVGISFFVLVVSSRGQNLQSYIKDMNKALAANTANTKDSVGSVSLSDGQNLIFTFIAPGPKLYLLVRGGPTLALTRWDVLVDDVTSITVNLRTLSEESISEAQNVFSAEGVLNYQAGDSGDLTEVDFASTESVPSIAIVRIDRNKLAKLPAGNATNQQVGAKTIYHKTASIIFADRNAARAFEKSLRDAIVVAKAQ